MRERLTSRLDTLYADAGDRLRARSLAAVLLALALGTVGGIPFVVALASKAWRAPVAVLGVVGLSSVIGGAAWLLFGGRLRQAVRLQAFGVWGVVSLAAVLPAGIASAEGAAILVTAVSLSILFLDRRDASLLVGLSLATVAVVGLAQANGIPFVPAAPLRSVALRGVLVGLSTAIAGLTLNAVSGRLLGLAGAAQTRVQSLTAALDLSRQAHASLQLDELLVALADGICERLGLFQVRVFVVDELAQAVDLRAVSGQSRPAMPWPSLRLPLDADSAVARAAASGRPVPVLGSQGGLALPLALDGRVLAVLEVQPGQPGVLTPTQMETLETLAAHAALALANARAFASEAALLEASSPLHRTLLALSSAQNLQQVYHAVLTGVAHVSGAARVLLFIAGPDPHQAVQYVEQVAVWQDGQVVTPGDAPRYALAAAPLLALFPRSRESLVFNDLRHDARLPTDVRAAYAGQGISALMIIPLATKTTWFGALVAESSDGHTFSGEQVVQSRTLADAAAVAVNSQTLVTWSLRAALRERVRRAITDAIQRAASADDMMQAADEGLVSALGKPLEVIQQARRGETELLTGEEWELVQDVDRQVRLAIANLRLLERTQHTMLQEQVISGITTDLQRASDVEDVLETAARTLRSVLDGYDVTLRLALPLDGQGPGQPRAAD